MFVSHAYLSELVIPELDVFYHTLAAAAAPT
jgi:hypothetical protein